MKAGVVVFPGSNCDRDLAVALRQAGFEVSMVWHKDRDLPAGLDVVALPGGFSFGDYLRCGAIAATSPVCRAVVEFANRGGYVLGICNGFQVLCEAGLLPGTLIRNAGIKFICRAQRLVVAQTDSVYTANYRAGAEIVIPIAHHDGNYSADAELVKKLQGEGRVAFRYLDNPNGSAGEIAGVLSENSRVLGMMPHPERAVDPAHGAKDGAEDGAALFKGLASIGVAA